MYELINNRGDTIIRSHRVMPATRPEIDQLIKGNWAFAKKYSNFLAKVKKARNQKYKTSEITKL